MSTFDFLEPSGTAVARSPMEGQALAAGARMELRDGWTVAGASTAGGRGARCATSVGFADLRTWGRSS